MSTSVLCFDNYKFPHNPKSLVISKKFLDGKEITQIEGDGELCGADCKIQLKNIKNLFEKGVHGVLCIPETDALFAHMTEFQFSFSTIPELIKYSFTFVGEKQRNSQNTRHYCVKHNETLWDLAKRLSCSVDHLVSLNKGKINSYSVSRGDVIVIPES